jgi:hypothetical protein
VATHCRKGVDKVRLAGPVSGFPSFDKLADVGHFSAHPSGDRGVWLQASDVYCEVYKGANGMRGIMEATPAKVLGWGDNVLVPPDEALKQVVPAMRGIFEESFGIEYTCGSGDLNVNRLDLPIDLHCDVDLPSYIAGLGSHMPKYARKRALYLGENGAQTLNTGTGARSGRVYDKEAESLGHPLAKGMVRFEPQLRKASLRRAGVWGVDSILTDSLERIRRDAFSHFGWDKVVCNAAGLGRALRLRVDMGLATRKQLASLGGHVLMGFDGLPDRTVRHYRRLLSDLGLAVDLEGFKLSDLDQEPIFVQANYERGRIEQLCVA